MSRDLTVGELQALREGYPPGVAAPGVELSEVIAALVRRGDWAAARLSKLSREARMEHDEGRTVAQCPATYEEDQLGFGPCTCGAAAWNAYLAHAAVPAVPGTDREPPELRPYQGNCPCCAQAQLEFADARKVECGNCAARFDASLVLEPGFPRSEEGKELLRRGLELVKAAGATSPPRMVVMTPQQWETLRRCVSPALLDRELSKPGYVYEWPEVGHYDGAVIRLTGDKP